MIDLSEVSIVDFSDELDRRGIKHVFVIEDLDGGIHTAVGGSTRNAISLMRDCAIPVLKMALRKSFVRPEDGESE